MADNFFDSDWTAKVTVPVKRVGERWEFFYGGDVPVKEGTLAELTLSADRITNAQFKQRVMQELTVKILDEGTEQLVALSDRDTNGGLAGEWPTPRPLALPAGTTRLERVWLGPVRHREGEPPLNSDMARGGLWLRLKGLERSELHASTVRMAEGYAEPVAISLNHSFTLLSERFEKHRISHTGNVYARVFYKEGNGHWYPLDDLRRGVQAEAERGLLQSAWAEVERSLGWRPQPPNGKRRKA